jgi:hypothetical protein
VRAEQTAGFCYAKDVPDGKPQLELQPYVYFECKPDVKRWTHILLRAWVKKKQVYEGIQLMPKAKLFDESWRLIGKVLLPLNPMKTIAENDSAFYVAITAYIEDGCIDPASVPEQELSAILLAVSSNAKLDTFRSHLNKFHYQQITENNRYTSYLLTEPEFVTQTERPRILMIFYESELIAVFHTRPVSVKLYDSIEMGSEYKMIYNSKFSEHTKEEMMKIYKDKIEKYKR